MYCAKIIKKRGIKKYSTLKKLKLIYFILLHCEKCNQQPNYNNNSNTYCPHFYTKQNNASI